MVKKEKFYICPHCAELTTETEVLNECSHGSSGMCGCDFIIPFWNTDYDCMDVDTPRFLHEYIEISEYWFNILSTMKNHILRKRHFNQIPKTYRMKKLSD